MSVDESRHSDTEDSQEAASAAAVDPVACSSNIEASSNTCATLDGEPAECPVCLEIIAFPVRFACQHAFCNSCVRRWVYDTEFEHRCPLCRTPWPEIQQIIIAEGFLMTGDTQAALHGIEEVLKSHTMLSVAYFVLGRIFRSAGLLEQALLAYQQAARLDATDADVHSNLGVVLRSLGRLDEAILAYNKAVHISPNCSTTHYNLGNALSSVGRSTEAADSLRRATVLNPTDHSAFCNLGAVLVNVGDHKGAVTAYCKAMEIDPTDSKTMFNLGQLLRVVGLDDEAERAFRNASLLGDADATQLLSQRAQDSEV